MRLVGYAVLQQEEPEAPHPFVLVRIDVHATTQYCHPLLYHPIRGVLLSCAHNLNEGTITEEQMRNQIGKDLKLGILA